MDMWNGRKLAFLPAGVALLLSGMAACSPVPKPLLAAERTETGQVRVLIAPCPDYDVLGLSVFLNDNIGEPEIWTARSKLRSGSPGQVELFTPPEGWLVSQSSLADTSRPGRYVIDVDGAVNKWSLDGEVAFTAEEFQRLENGKVITGTRDGEVMDRTEFMKPDSDRCEP
ncbi:hypothetical protein [Streptomyces sp. NPDC002054]|uniref:hypothetical protein n=1 Tax=Streptomyces sp. NPDC002054 TaxID=3154663 RepID=UPI003325B47C